MFDVEDFGQAVYAQVVRSELAQRLPDASIRVFTPQGRATRADRGEPAEELGASPPDDFDVVVIGGAGLARVPQLVTPVPGARWHVTNDEDAAALRRAGVAGTVNVTPHPAVLLPRLLSPGVLAKRLDYLRLMGWYPAGGALVIQGDIGIEPQLLQRVLDDHPGLTLVVDGHQAVDRPLKRLPATLSVEDVAAAISAADGFIGSDEAGCLVALAYGIPAVRLAFDGETSHLPAEHVARHPDAVLAAFAHAVKSAVDAEPLQRTVDDWLDSVVAGAPEAGDDPATRAALESELRALRLAYRVRVERANAERVLLADRAAEADAELAALRGDVAQLRHLAAAEADAHARYEAEVVALRETRTFRWTAAARALYRNARGD